MGMIRLIWFIFKVSCDGVDTKGFDANGASEELLEDFEDVGDAMQDDKIAYSNSLVRVTVNAVGWISLTLSDRMHTKTQYIRSNNTNIAYNSTTIRTGHPVYF